MAYLNQRLVRHGIVKQIVSNLRSQPSKLPIPMHWHPDLLLLPPLLLLFVCLCKHVLSTVCAVVAQANSTCEQAAPKHSGL